MQQTTFSIKDKNGTDRATGSFMYPYEVPALTTVNTPEMSGIELIFQRMDPSIDCFLFHINANVEPCWFGVAVPQAVRDFSHPHIFFHPQPHQAGLHDGRYANFITDPDWAAVYRYVASLGMQLAATPKKQFVIVPFLTQRICKPGVGIFNAEWLDIVKDIQDQLKRKYGLSAGGGIEELVVSSFSAGLEYSHLFRTGGKDVQHYLREVYDFDGLGSSSASRCSSVVTRRGVRGWRYDKVGNSLDLKFLTAEAGQGRFHLPWERWARVTPQIKPRGPGPNLAKLAEEDVHARIIQRMFYHACALSKVG
jgi:hypothetical protein